MPGPFVRVKPYLYIHECMYNPKVTLTLHKCHSYVTLLSPSDKRKAPRVSLGAY